MGRRDAPHSWRKTGLSRPCRSPFLKVSSRLLSPLLAKHPPSCQGLGYFLLLFQPLLASRSPKHQMHSDWVPRSYVLDASREPLGPPSNPTLPAETGQRNAATYALLFRGAHNEKITQPRFHRFIHLQEKSRSTIFQRTDLLLTSSEQIKRGTRAHSKTPVKMVMRG